MLVFTPCRLSILTDSEGQALLRARVPGTFQGLVFDPVTVTHGRFLKEATIWADAPVAGDTLTGMRVEDDQGILALIPDPLNPGKAVSERFPAYPVIRCFQDTVAEPLLGGLFVLPNEPLRFSVFDKANSEFIPSGFSLVALYKSNAEGKTIRANFSWGTYLASAT